MEKDSAQLEKLQRTITELFNDEKNYGNKINA